jgi:hypothetical protein
VKPTTRPAGERGERGPIAGKLTAEGKLLDAAHRDAEQVGGGAGLNTAHAESVSRLVNTRNRNLRRTKPTQHNGDNNL